MTCTVWWLLHIAVQVQLNNGVFMPTIGFGSAALGDSTGEAVAQALRVGYTHIDSAQAREWYREDLVGEALRTSGIPRDKIFITTKIHPRHLGYEVTKKVFMNSLVS